MLNNTVVFVKNNSKQIKLFMNQINVLTFFIQIVINNGYIIIIIAIIAKFNYD